MWAKFGHIFPKIVHIKIKCLKKDVGGEMKISSYLHIGLSKHVWFASLPLYSVACEPIEFQKYVWEWGFEGKGTMNLSSW